MKQEEVFKIFGEALSAQPEPPLRFLLYFMSGTTEMTAESQRRIPDILGAIEAHKSRDISISIVGHTDRVGSREANYKLGLERADSIKAILVSNGIDPSVIEVASHGEDNPLVKTEDKVAEPRNRRIEITVR
jgi:outer membrane protein OmpA-like peptidoglycan-associated protein